MTSRSGLPDLPEILREVADRWPDQSLRESSTLRLVHVTRAQWCAVIGTVDTPTSARRWQRWVTKHRHLVVAPNPELAASLLPERVVAFQVDVGEVVRLEPDEAPAVGIRHLPRGGPRVSSKRAFEVMAYLGLTAAMVAELLGYREHSVQRTLKLGTISLELSEEIEGLLDTVHVFPRELGIPTKKLRRITPEVLRQALVDNGGRLAAAGRQLGYLAECRLRVLVEHYGLEELLYSEHNRAFTRDVVAAALERAGGVVTSAGRELGISRGRMSRLARKYRLQPRKIARVDRLDHNVLRCLLDDCGWEVNAVARRLGVDRLTVRCAVRRFGLDGAYEFRKSVRLARQCADSNRRRRAC